MNSDEISARRPLNEAARANAPKPFPKLAAAAQRQRGAAHWSDHARQILDD